MGGGGYPKDMISDNRTMGNETKVNGGWKTEMGVQSKER